MRKEARITEDTPHEDLHLTFDKSAKSLTIEELAKVMPAIVKTDKSKKETNGR